MLSEGNYTGIVYVILSINLLDIYMRSLPSINMLQLASIVFAGSCFLQAFFLSFIFCMPFIFYAGLYQDLSASLSTTLIIKYELIK